MIPALVLTAGLATRLRPLSFVRAKAALPVAGVPIVVRILEQLKAAGVTETVLNLHHRPDSLTHVVGDGSGLGLRVRYSWEDPVLGSAGGPARAVPLLRTGDDEPFLIVNGDTLTDVDLPAMVRAHRGSGALVTMAVVPNDHPGKYGGAVLADDDSITRFVARGSTEASWHVVGVQVAQPEAFVSVPKDEAFESVRTLYPALIAARPGAVRAFRCRAGFFDIGTPADYLDTSLAFAAREGTGVAAGERTTIHPSADIAASVLWDDVTIEEGVRLRECIVTDGVRVPSDTSWHGVTLRVAHGELLPDEREYDGMAIGSL